MNDSFKCIILISCDKKDDDLNNNNKTNIINDRNSNMKYLSENNEF